MDGIINKKDKVTLVSFTVVIMIVGIAILIFSFKSVEDKRYILLQTSANNLIKDKRFEEAINVLNEMKIMNKNDEIIARTIDELKNISSVRDEINIQNLNLNNSSNVVKYVVSNKVYLDVEKITGDEKGSLESKKEDSDYKEDDKRDQGLLSHILDNLKDSTNSFFRLFK